MEIIKYNPDYKKLWDDFVESSKNGTFLFHRDYMEYHADRFQDNSFIFYHKSKPYCLLPACRIDDVLGSHAGLTYGGLVMNDKCTAEGILEVFDLLLARCHETGISKIIYKTVPFIYTTLPSQEDLYALFRNNASLKIRNIATVIDRHNILKYPYQRRTALKKASGYQLKVMESHDLEGFWEIMGNNLREKYNAAPVHSLSEMQQLMSSFPDNIKLYGVMKDQRMIAGGVFYISRHVIHSQYMHASEEGKEHGATEILVDYLLKNVSPQCRYFDMGTSNEDSGRYLNVPLISNKESYGGRAICYDTYEITL